MYVCMYVYMYYYYFEEGCVFSVINVGVRVQPTFLIFSFQHVRSGIQAQVFVVESTLLAESSC